MATHRIPPRALVPQGTGLTNMDAMLLESARKELAYHMGAFKKSGDEWHRQKAKAYQRIVQNLQSKEADNATA